MTGVRQLPWTGPQGKRSYVIGDGDGPVSRLADEMEYTQLARARHLLGRAEVVLRRPGPPDIELRALAVDLAAALGDVLAIAECGRGGREG
ncbi:hypothetical protein [Streptomyces sp. NPDC006368]|uniref:hypothetical protein n=1 Tax=Streptomyces sp. NPDC006368 TaxID=3156760 RepID=UPI0033A98618